MLQYRQEFLADVSSDILPLIAEHWEEIALNKDSIKLNPDWEAYKALEYVGKLKVFTATEVHPYICIENTHVIVHRFFAQELCEYFPDAVTTGSLGKDKPVDTKDTRQVDCSKLTPPLPAEIKNTCKHINKLEVQQKERLPR